MLRKPLIYSRAKMNEISSWIKEVSHMPIGEEILDVPIDQLELSVRASNALKQNGIRKISDVMLFGPEKLCQVKNVGKKTIYEIGNAIRKVLLSEPNKVMGNRLHENSFEAHVEEVNLVDAIESILLCITPKYVHIIKARYGYDDGKYKTLEEIGKKAGLTRERVRQIIVKEIRRIRHPIRRKILQSIIENIERLLLHYKGIISIHDIAKDEYFTAGSHNQLRFLTYLIAELYEERYRIINKYFLTSLTDEEIKVLQSDMREAALNCHFPIDEGVFMEKITSSVGPISEHYLAYYLFYKEHIEISKGKVLSPGRLSIPQRVKLLMIDIDKPMHFTEIAKLYRNHFRNAKKTQDFEHAIHTRIGDSKDFIIVAPGTFVLRDKFKIPDNIDLIVEKSKEILRDIKNVSDTKYLIKELRKRNIDIGNLNPYSLKSILNEYPGFVRYRKFEIGIEELADKCERRPLVDLIYEILLSNSKPMRVKAICKEIQKKRGFPEYAIYQCFSKNAKFIKIGIATYTVKENIAAYEDKSRAIVKFAKDWLKLKKKAISAFLISEVSNVSQTIKDLSLGLVEHVLATSPEFLRLPNGFYDLADK